MRSSVAKERRTRVQSRAVPRPQNAVKPTFNNSRSALSKKRKARNQVARKPNSKNHGATTRRVKKVTPRKKERIKRKETNRALVFHCRQAIS